MGTISRQTIEGRESLATGDVGRIAAPRRRRRALATFLAGATALAVLAAAPSAYGDPAADRDAIRKQQADVAAKLDAAKASTEEVIAALTTLDQQVQAGLARKADAERAHEDAVRRVGELELKLGENQKEIDRLGNSLREQAVRRYLSPEHNDRSVNLLTASDFDEAEQRHVLANAVIGNTHDLIEKLQATRAETEALRQQADDTKAQAEKAKKDIEGEMLDLYVQIAAQQKLRDEWARRIDGLQADHGRLDAAEKDLARSLANQQRGLSAGPAAAPAPSSGSSGMIWPTRGGISRGFFPGHDGIDIFNATNTPIWAALPGRVVSAGWNSGGYGNFTCIDHGNNLQTCYAHQNTIQVSAGQQVSKGQQIGLMGTTGNSTGTHLHFETRVGGKALDPRNYLTGNP